MTGTTESYGTNTPCTRQAGDKWEEGNGGRRQEDSVKLCKQSSLGDGCSVELLGSLCFSRFKMLKAVSCAKSRPYIKR